jgi:hypothetical protein
VPKKPMRDRSIPLQHAESEALLWQPGTPMCDDPALKTLNIPYRMSSCSSQQLGSASKNTRSTQVCSLRIHKNPYAKNRRALKIYNLYFSVRLRAATFHEQIRIVSCDRLAKLCVFSTGRTGNISIIFFYFYHLRVVNGVAGSALSGLIDHLLDRSATRHNRTWIDRVC